MAQLSDSALQKLINKINKLPPGQRQQVQDAICGETETNLTSLVKHIKSDDMKLRVRESENQRLRKENQLIRHYIDNEYQEVQDLLYGINSIIGKIEGIVISGGGKRALKQLRIASGDLMGLLKQLDMEVKKQQYAGILGDVRFTNSDFIRKLQARVDEFHEGRDKTGHGVYSLLEEYTWDSKSFQIREKIKSGINKKSHITRVMEQTKELVSEGYSIPDAHRELCDYYSQLTIEAIPSKTRRENLEQEIDWFFGPGANIDYFRKVFNSRDDDLK